jgi:hypothetical protein
LEDVLTVRLSRHAFLVFAEGAIVRTTFKPHLALLAVFDERHYAWTR